MGNTREQLFHARRSFHFNENAETLDSYVTCRGQVATLLGYGKPQILEVFTNTLPTRLHLVLFPIEGLRQVVETAKRILTKEKIDRQLAGQPSSTSFMGMKDGYTSKRVTFDTPDALEEKINRLTAMMSKLTAQDDGQKKQFKTNIFQRKRRGEMKMLCDKHNYDQRNYQNRYRSNTTDRRISFSGQIQCGQNYRDRPRYEQSYRNDFRRGSFKGNMRMNQNFRGQNYRGRYRENYRNDRGRSRSRERKYQGNIRRNDRSSNSRSRSGS